MKDVRNIGNNRVISQLVDNQSVIKSYNKIWLYQQFFVSLHISNN